MPGIITVNELGCDLETFWQRRQIVFQWTKIAVRTNLTGSVELTDSAATKHARRFYRAVVP